MSIFEQIELEDKIMKICRSLHERLCSDNADLEDSIMTSGEVNQLEPTEALKHMTEAIKDLLSHQRNIKIYKEHKTFHKSEAVQTTLQKLEADIREHIKVENQLKLYCENLEGAIEEEEIEIKKVEAGFKDKFEKREKEKMRLKAEAKGIEEEICRVKSGSIENNKDSDAGKEPEAEIQAENDQKNGILMEKYGKLKKLKEAVKNKENMCKELTKENKELIDFIKKVEEEKKNSNIFNNSKFYKTKYREKCKVVARLKKKSKKVDRSGAKSMSPLTSTVRNSTVSPISKIVGSREIKKKSPNRVHTRNSKSLYRTLQNPLTRL